MPEYAKAWGYPMPEALALGEVWLAKSLYPQKFQETLRTGGLRLSRACGDE